MGLIKDSRMTALVDDLVSLARLDEFESRPLVADAVDLTEVVLASIDAARTLAPDRPIRAHIDGVLWVNGQGSRLRQVVDNLLGNTRVHAPSGTTCELELRSHGNDAVLVVSDDGPGLPDAQLEKIFDRFYRADSARSRATGGSGLGLSIVQALVHAHGGSITATGRAPHGLCITVRLPRARRDEDRDGAES